MMAEYVDVIYVITLAAIAVLTALSVEIIGTINRIIGLIPTLPPRPTAGFRFSAARRGAPRQREGRCSTMTFSDWLEFARANWKKEDGQTMAEYGVVLAVITIGAVAVFTALSGGITGAINRVIGLLPK